MIGFRMVFETPYTLGSTAASFATGDEAKEALIDDLQARSMYFRVNRSKQRDWKYGRHLRESNIHF